MRPICRDTISIDTSPLASSASESIFDVLLANHGVALEADGDFGNAVGFGLLAERGLGALVAAAVEHGEGAVHGDLLAWKDWMGTAAAPGP